MKKMIATLLVLGLVVSGVSSVGFAFGGPAGKGGQQPYNNRSYNNYDNPLDLNEEQLEKFDDLRDEFFEKRDNIREEVWETNQELRDLQFGDATDEEVANLRNKINNLQTELNNLRFNYRENMKDVLTAEQIEKLDEFQDERNSGPRRGGQRGSGGRGNHGNSGFRGKRNGGRGMKNGA